MRKLRLTLFASSCIAITSLMLSCSKSTSEYTKPAQQPRQFIAPGSAVSVNPLTIMPGWQNNKAYVSYYTTGNYANQYICGWGSGITFGTNLPHPITNDPYGTYDGELIPTISYVGWTLNPTTEVYTMISGAYFSVLTPTLTSGDPRTTITNYQKKVSAYWKDTTGTVAYPSPLGTTSGGSGFQEVRGMLVRDHMSPTKMSVTSDKYKTVSNVVKNAKDERFVDPNNQ